MKLLPNMIASGDLKALLLYGYDRGFISYFIKELIKKLNFFRVNLSVKESTEDNIILLANSSNFFKQQEFLKIDYSSSVLSKKFRQFLVLKFNKECFFF